MARILALAGLFSAGIGAGWASRAPAPPVAHASEPTSSIEASCVDRAAMEANENLVAELRDYRKKLERTEERAHAAEEARLAIESASPLFPSRAEWSRMARSETVRLRVPCSHWSQNGKFQAPRAHGGYVSFRSRGRSTDDPRTKASALSKEELEALDGAYERASERTWAAMRTTCEARPSFREFIDDREGRPTAHERIAACLARVLSPSDDATRPALLRVAELHGAGAGIERATTDEQRVAFAVSQAPAVLHEEMVRVLGSEPASRALDNGVFCLDETLYDLRRPPMAPAEVPDG